MKIAKRIIGFALYIIAVLYALQKFGHQAVAAVVLGAIGMGLFDSATMDELDEMLETAIEAGLDLARYIAQERGIDLDKELEAPADE